MTASDGKWSSTFLSELVVNIILKIHTKIILAGDSYSGTHHSKPWPKTVAQAVELTGTVSSYNFGAYLTNHLKRKSY